MPLKSDKQWKKELPIESIVFATVDFSKPKSFLEKSISDGFILKENHNKDCGLLLLRKVPWSEKMIWKINIELEKISEIVYKNHFTYDLQCIEEDPNILILYI